VVGAPLQPPRVRLPVCLPSSMVWRSAAGTSSDAVHDAAPVAAPRSGLPGLIRVASRLSGPSTTARFSPALPTTTGSLGPTGALDTAPPDRREGEDMPNARPIWSWFAMVGLPW